MLRPFARDFTSSRRGLATSHNYLWTYPAMDEISFDKSMIWLQQLIRYMAKKEFYNL